ncbi:MAG: PilZ domain-containing protein [Candidatus Omnitrophica bacterium]|nr:PilZ domain-containing protein [Candidatus Omnitrophota bacterium]
MENFHIGAENRKYPRVPFKRSVKCTIGKDDVQTGEIAQDLSEGGIRIRSNLFISLGQEVNLSLQLHEAEEIVEVTGRVVWVRYIPHSEIYQVGIEFAQEAEAPRSRIGRFAGSVL